MTRYDLPSAMFSSQLEHLFIRMTVMLLLIVSVSESAVMLLFSWLDLASGLPPFAVAGLDVLMLFSFASIPLYLWVIKPVKEAINASLHRHDLLSSAVRNAGDGIMISNREGVIEYVNQAFRDMLQCTNEDVVGQPIDVVHPVMATSSWKRRFIYAIQRDHIWHDEQWGVRQNGEKYLAKVTVTPIIVHEHIANFITIVSDQTSHHNLEVQYHQAQKMEAVGTMVGGIAHDFNNMLSSLSAHIYMAKTRLEKKPTVDTQLSTELLNHLSTMESLNAHAADMIRQLMTFARKGTVEKTAMGLDSFVKEALKLAEVSLPSNIIFQHAVQDENLLICANATQLQQALMNLINNARDALEGVDQPKISINLSKIDRHAHSFLCKVSAPAHAYVEIRVADNGCGIDAENMSKITDPFFTTKREGKGTGLGLAMVYGIVEQHHGYMDIKSEPGAGTTFHLFLPLTEERCCCVSESEHIYPGNGETILLVDDQQHVRESCRELLESLGYTVLEAADGIEALDVYANHGESIAAVVSDIVMPRLTGVELATRIKQYNPAMPVVLVSGYDKDAALNQQARLLVDQVLAKPFSVASISHVLYQLLHLPHRSKQRKHSAQSSHPM